MYLKRVLRPFSRLLMSFSIGFNGFLLGSTKKLVKRDKNAKFWSIEQIQNSSRKNRIVVNY